MDYQRIWKEKGSERLGLSVTLPALMPLHEIHCQEDPVPPRNIDTYLGEGYLVHLILGTLKVSKWPNIWFQAHQIQDYSISERDDRYPQAAAGLTTARATGALENITKHLLLPKMALPVRL
jgi:hypothetical protein